MGHAEDEGRGTRAEPPAGAGQGRAHAGDLALSARILAGDREAAEALFARHFETLYDFVAWRVGRERGTTEDVVQDTLTTAVQRLASYSGESSLHTWMCGIAKNKIRALRRKQRPLPIEDVLAESGGEIDAILAELDSTPLPEEIAEARETRELVGATLSSLPPDYRAALIGKYIDGRSVPEMALAAGRGIKATESTLHRARAAFARVFGLLLRKRGEVGG